jgi:hypothetical protein
MTKSRHIIAPKAPWSPEREALMREFYPHVPALEIAKALGVSKPQVYRRARALGLVKSEAFLQSELSGRVQRGKQHPGIVGNQFKPGLVPWNKGKHVVAGGRSAETRFKTGDRPVNWMPLGAVRVNYYGVLERKVREGNNGGKNWEGVHRLVWKEHHGPIPRGHMVAFKGGKPLTKLEEITPDALECISHAENLRRNGIWTKSPELAQLYQLKGQINRQVNRIKKEKQCLDCT